MEQRKDVSGYEGLYRVSDEGIVESYNYRLTGKLHALTPRYHQGYQRVVLYKHKQKKQFQVHRIVAFEFVENIENKPQINHINSIRDDNRACNLERCTNLENQQKSRSEGGRIDKSHNKYK